MVLIAVLAGAAALVIKAYRALHLANGQTSSAVMESITQQAAVIGTMANAVFAIIEAVTTLKVASSRVPVYTSSTPGTGIGRPSGMSTPLGIAAT